MDPSQNSFYAMYPYQQGSDDGSGYAGSSSGQSNMTYTLGFSPETKLVESLSNAKDEVEGDGDDDGDGEEVDTAKEDEVKRSQSTESLGSWEREGLSPKKKPRVTLARGGACVACRNRKLKCSGERPCKTCIKNEVDCKYEEIQRRKPRATLLEERVVELEAILLSRGEALPPTTLQHLPPHPVFSSSMDSNAAMNAKRPSYSGSGFSSSSSHSSQPVHPPALSLRPDFPPSAPTPNGTSANIAPSSALELALINVVLPHTPHLGIPLHPQRFLALLTLPPSSVQRPHPALMYILFAEAVRILESGIPAPALPSLPRSLFPQHFAPQMPAPSADPTHILQHVRGMGLSLLERARHELDAGIRNVDRPFDLVRAAIGITRYLYSLGRFIEGWNVPVCRLIVSCGLHRNIGTIVPPNSASQDQDMPAPYAQSSQYFHTHSVSPHNTGGLPMLRMRPVIIPPARDEIEVAERTLTFWAAKAQDWAAGIGWGWTTALSDSECITQWPWGTGVPEPRQRNQPCPYFSLDDLHDLTSPLHLSLAPDTTYVLALKSLALLHRASDLFDLPLASLPSPHSPRPTHIPPLSACQAVQAAIQAFRRRIPVIFQDGQAPQSPQDEVYDGLADPWWIMLHANLYTAELLMYKELGHHQRQAYDAAVSCARAFVKLIQRIQAEQWCHVDMVVALDTSLVARFLNKESQRLAANGQPTASRMANDEAEVLRVALARDYAKYMPMANLHALIVQRVKEGWPEKEGEYERV